MTETQRKSLLFREVNERIRALADRWDTPGSAGFVCECSDAECSELLDLTVADYDALRASSEHFVVIRGHASAAGDLTVDARDAAVRQRNAPANAQPA